MSVPYIFATATSNLPLAQLDANFTYFTDAITVSSGNVGIGTGSPAYKLDVVGTVNVVNGSNGRINIGATNNYVYGDNSGNFIIGTSGTDRLLINSSGNVGINATSITSLASLTTLQIGTGSGGAIRFGTLAYAYANSSLAEFGTIGATDVSFFTNNTSRMRIDTNGYALIGYTSSNGAYRLQVNSQIFATSSTIATSDGRYKENVNTLENALDLVCALNPVSFDWKQHPVHNFDRSTTTTGFIAQEVQTALQNTDYVNAIVKTNTCVIEPEEKDADGNVTKPAVTEEFLGIAEGNLIAVLTAAIQELKAELDSVKSQLATLQGN